MTPGPQSQELATPWLQALQTWSIRWRWSESFCKAWQLSQTWLWWIQTRFLCYTTSFQNSKSFCYHIELTFYKLSVYSQRYRGLQRRRHDGPELPWCSSYIIKYQITAIGKYMKSVFLCTKMLSDCNGFPHILKMNLTFHTLKAVHNVPSDHAPWSQPSNEMSPILKRSVLWHCAATLTRPLLTFL